MIGRPRRRRVQRPRGLVVQGTRLGWSEAYIAEKRIADLFCQSVIGDGNVNVGIRVLVIDSHVGLRGLPRA